MAAATLSLAEETASDLESVVILVARGQLTAETAGALESKVAALLVKGTRGLVLDLSGVEYVASAGFGLIVSFLRGFRDKGGDLALCGLTPAVRKMFELLHFHAIVKSAADRKGALGLLTDALGRPGGGGISPLPRGAAVESEEFRREKKGKA